MHRQQNNQQSLLTRSIATAIAAFLFAAAPTHVALSLSEIPSVDSVDDTDNLSASEPGEAITAEEGEDASDTLIDKVAPLVEKLTGSGDEIVKDLTTLPDPVARMRQLILEAAMAGDINAVATLMNPGPEQTVIGPDNSGNDLATALKDMSGDPDGLEILAIMLDLLSTGYAHIGKGTADEIYVWPYFVRAPISELSADEKVDLMRIVTAGDYLGMLEFGGYNFYRIGITPDGQWRFFLAGD